MAIETLEDIAEEVANGFGVYGACDERSCDKKHCCRCAFVPALIERMRNAAAIEARLKEPRSDGE